MTQPSYKQDPSEVLKYFQSSLQGLSQQEATLRLVQYGKNELEKKKKTSAWVVFFRQLLNPLVLILIFALLVKIYFGQYPDSIVLGGTIFLMALIGFFQEIKAEKAIEALKKLSSHKSKVLRDTKIVVIESENLVPGDLIFLEMGDKVPADARILESKNLKVDESMITGESQAAKKTSETLIQDCSITDQHNMVFAATIVRYGKALACVTDTGMKTEIGKIAKSLSEIKIEKTPLQKNIQSIGIKMIYIIFCAIAFFAIISFYRGISLKEIFFLSVSAAVSAIPESLPAAFTITLATGMYRMAKKNAIIRKLIAVETLGSTTVICSDKTGTLTLNQMSCVKLASKEKVIDFSLKNSHFEEGSVFYKMLVSGALCNDATLTKNGKNPEFLGDPTEVAILKAASDIGLDKLDLEKTFERTKEIPFTSENLFMATLNKAQNHKQLHVKGAPEKILSLCSQVETDKGLEPLTRSTYQNLSDLITEMSSQALRILAIAYCPVAQNIEVLSESDLKGNLIFLGFIGLMDPPRTEVKEAIQNCKKAGVHVIMITGDNPNTALAIAKEIGIESDGALTGLELKDLSDDELFEKIKKVSVFARVEPMQKLKIVHALKAHGQIIAMTGDGINDAPALQEANIGIAMGLKGTDVAKEVSDMVLADDRFDSIVAAVEEGRAVFSRLRNITAFLVTTCYGELLALILCVLFLGKAPLTPIQIIWINLVTGALMAIPLGLEPKNGLEMLSPPRSPDSKLIFSGMLYRISYLALLLGVFSFFLFNYSSSHEEINYAKTMVLTSIVVFEWLIAIQYRTDEIPLKKIGFFKNKWLLISISSVFILHLIILYVPFLNPFFNTQPLNLSDWLIALIPGGAIFMIESIRKSLFPRIFSHKNGFNKSFK